MKETKDVLVGGIGNVFFGDDAFGVTVVQRLLAMTPCPFVVCARPRIVDFGIRSFDLAMAIPTARLVVLVDVVSRGKPPGTLFVLESEDLDPADIPDGHGLDPVQAIALSRAFGMVPPIRIVGCEPASLAPADTLSPAVSAAVPGAIALVQKLVEAAHA